MAKPKGAGVSDELRLTVTHAPVVRMTDITQLELRRLILKHIKGLPEMRGFKILTEPEDDGIQFIVSISGKGEKSRGRQPELMVVHFEVVNPKKAQEKVIEKLLPDGERDPNPEVLPRLVISQEMWDKVEALRVAILLSPQLKSLNLKVYDRTYWSGYDLEDDLPPRKFALTLEFYPPEQDELEKKVAVRGRKSLENRTKDALLKALRTPKIREEIKRCVK